MVSYYYNYIYIYIFPVILTSCLAAGLQLQILEYKTTLSGNMQMSREEARQEALGFGFILNPETIRLMVLITNGVLGL